VQGTQTDTPRTLNMETSPGPQAEGRTDNASGLHVGRLGLSPAGQGIAHHYAHHMQLNWRITTVRQKVLYIVLGSATIALFFLALRTWLLDGRSWPYAAIGVLINLSYTLLAVRTFRGHLEPAAPPRPWWRWTGRPQAGYWLGSLNLLAGCGAIRDFWPHRGLTPDLPAVIMNVLVFLIISFGYFNSSFRLRRHPELWSQKKRAKPPVPAIGP